MVRPAALSAERRAQQMTRQNAALAGITLLAGMGLHCCLALAESNGQRAEKPGAAAVPGRNADRSAVDQLTSHPSLTSSGSRAAGSDSEAI